MKLKKKEMQAKLADLLSGFKFKYEEDCNVWVLGEPWHDVFLVANVERGKYRMDCRVRGELGFTTIEKLEAFILEYYGWRVR